MQVFQKRRQDDEKGKKYIAQASSTLLLYRIVVSFADIDSLYAQTRLPAIRCSLIVYMIIQSDLFGPILLSLLPNCLSEDDRPS